MITYWGAGNIQGTGETIELLLGGALFASDDYHG